LIAQCYPILKRTIRFVYYRAKGFCKILRASFLGKSNNM
jgi:hypothetical protein